MKRLRATFRQGTRNTAVKVLPRKSEPILNAADEDDADDADDAAPEPRGAEEEAAVSASAERARAAARTESLEPLPPAPDTPDIGLVDLDRDQAPPPTSRPRGDGGADEPDSPPMRRQASIASVGAAAEGRRLDEAVEVEQLEDLEPPGHVHEAWQACDSAKAASDGLCRKARLPARLPPLGIASDLGLPPIEYLTGKSRRSRSGVLG